MLPSRGISRRISPAAALRHTTKVLRPSPTSPRAFSQWASRGSHAPVLRGAFTSLPRCSAIPSGAGASSAVFASRTGASRNLSLWPFGSKSSSTPSPPLPESAAAATPSPPTWEAQPSSSAATSPESFPATTTPPPTGDAFASAPTPGTTPEPAWDVGITDLEYTESLLDAPETIGFLKNFGLEYGWGPTSACEWLLEHIYVYTGLPWWACLAAAAAVWRGLIFFPQLRSSHTSALMQANQRTPEYQEAAAAFKEAAHRSGDQHAMLQARARMKAISAKSGVNMWWLPVPFLTIPFSFGMFRLIRGMSAIPVPSLETGGVAWFTDLTLSDPYYILPLVNVALGVLMFQQQQRLQMNPTAQSQAMMRAMVWMMPPAIFLSTAWLPAGLQWFFLCLTASTVVQSSATMTPAVRQWAGLPPLLSAPGGAHPTSGAATYQAPRPRGGSKGTVNDAIEGVKETFGQTDEKKRHEKAQAYEARRAAEEQEKAARRLEEARRRFSNKKRKGSA